MLYVGTELNFMILQPLFPSAASNDWRCTLSSMLHVFHWSIWAFFFFQNFCFYIISWHIIYFPSLSARVIFVLFFGDITTEKDFTLNLWALLMNIMPTSFSDSLRTKYYLKRSKFLRPSSLDQLAVSRVPLIFYSYFWHDCCYCVDEL